MEEILIEKVRCHEVLFNFRCSDYRDQDVRQEAWEEIGRDLAIEAEKAKRLWEKLRRCYTNALNRRRFKKSGTSNRKNMPWRFEHEMSFLLPFLDNRKSHINLHDSKSSHDITNEDITLHEDQTKEHEYIDFPYQDNIDIQEEKFQPENERSKRVTEGEISEMFESIKRLKKEQAKKNNIPHELMHIDVENADPRKTKHQERMDPQATKQYPLEKLDETDMFFMSMARMTKKLPKVEQARIKLMLSDAVLKAEMNNERSNHYNDSSD